jgi:hypothetical protein
VRAGPTDAERPWRIIDDRPVSYDFDVDAKGDNAEFHLAQKRNEMSRPGVGVQIKHDGQGNL